MHSLSVSLPGGWRAKFVWRSRSLPDRHRHVPPGPSRYTIQQGSHPLLGRRTMTSGRARTVLPGTARVLSQPSDNERQPHSSSTAQAGPQASGCGEWPLAPSPDEVPRARSSCGRITVTAKKALKLAHSCRTSRSLWSWLYHAEAGERYHLDGRVRLGTVGDQRVTALVRCGPSRRSAPGSSRIDLPPRRFADRRTSASRRVRRARRPAHPYSIPTTRRDWPD